MVLLLGSLAFLLMIFYDMNQIRFHLKIGKWAFAAGGALLSVVTVYLCVQHWGGVAQGGLLSYVWLFISLLFLGLLVYTLFFALPFEKTYVEQQKLEVYDKGVYALCRHPGILWFFFCYLFLSIALSSVDVMIACFLFSGWNLLYAYLQDRIIFPQQLSGYRSYQERVPFLIPTAQSIAACFHK